VFVANAHCVFGNVRTWGWITLIIGVMQVLAAAGCFRQPAGPLARRGGTRAQLHRPDVAISLDPLPLTGVLGQHV
jgi:hypothetical protein